jgi:hypothetical protein
MKLIVNGQLKEFGSVETRPSINASVTNAWR